MRHGQHRNDGFDPLLTDLGRNQASQIGGEYDLVIVSPLRRTLDTYIHSGIKTRELIMVPIIREQRRGTPTACLALEDVNFKEDSKMVMGRVIEFTKFLKTLPHTNIMIVSHAFFMCHFLDYNKQDRNLIAECQQFKFSI